MKKQNKDLRIKKYQLIPVRQHYFRLKEFADRSIEFIMENEKVTAVKQLSPAGEYVSKRMK